MQAEIVQRQIEQLWQEAEQMRVDLADATAICQRHQERLGQLKAAFSPRDNTPWLLFPLDVVWPVSGEFGIMYTINGVRWEHEGIDFACPLGCKVMACASGVVKFVGIKAGYGNFIQLQHQHAGGIWRTGYAHLASMDCQVGQSIIARQMIGASGQSGNVSGPHLHLTVWSPDSTFKPDGCGEYLRGVDNPRKWLVWP